MGMNSRLTENLKMMKVTSPDVDIVKDLPYKPEYTNNSFFAIGHAKSEGHVLNYLFHMMSYAYPGKEPEMTYCFSVTDETTKEYYQYSHAYTFDEVEAPADRYLIKTPKGTMSGTWDDMKLVAEIDDAAIDLNLEAIGYPIYNGGTGKFHMVGMDIYEYSVPNMRTNGTIRVGNKTYQALSEIKREAVNDRYVVSQIALVKNENGRIVTKEWFDTGVESKNDASMGGLIGSLIGIIGGPIGMLLGGGMGYLAGSAKDADDVESNVSMVERVSNQIVDGETALISLVQEVSEGSYEARLYQWQTSTVVEDAAEVAAEIEKAENLQREMEKNARKQMREEKIQAGKEKIEETRSKIKANFEELISKRNK